MLCCAVSWGGLVFAGGESRRMGCDKALLEIGGATLLERAVTLVRRAGGTPFVIGRRRPRDQVAGALQIDEADRAGRPACGPLMALRWGLVDSGAERVLALACDLPFVTVDLIRYLITQSGGVDAVVPRCGETMHVLTAVYTSDCLPAIDRRLAVGERAVHPLLDDLRVRIVGEEDLAHFGGAPLLDNINTPEQFARAKVVLERGTV